MEFPIDSIYEVSPVELLGLNLRTRKQMFRFQGNSRNKEQVRSEIDRSTVRWRIGRFCDMCKAYNIDPMSQCSVHILFMKMCKVQDKETLLNEFSIQTSTEEEVQAVEINSPNATMFNDVNDWITLLNYGTIRVKEEEEAEKNEVCNNLTTSMVKGNLDTEYACQSTDIMHLALHMMLQDIPAVKMIEQKITTVQLAMDRSVCRDLELRCLRCIAAFNDLLLTDETLRDNLLQIVTSLTLSDVFYADVWTVLQMRDEVAAQAETSNKPIGRLQLRELAKTLHATSGRQYSSTFDAWAIQQKFSVTTNRKLQMFLYFIKTQSVQVNPSIIRKFFSDSLLAKINGHSIDHIDKHAITFVINSIRIYSHNIACLVDFRTRCLVGISQTYMKKLNMAQIVQLYISCYQHESVRESVWRTVVPVWNFTIETACNKFRTEFVYDIDSVVNCIMNSMMNKWDTTQGNEKHLECVADENDNPGHAHAIQVQ